MKVHNSDTPALNALSELRALSPDSATSFDALRMATRKQALLLAKVLRCSPEKIPSRIEALIPGIVITYVDDVPLPSITFWADKQWHMHVRANDPTQVQILTILQELKRIIDHRPRDRLTATTGKEREALAKQFAHDVLAAMPEPLEAGETV
jgi:hypothetical protein